MERTLNRTDNEQELGGDKDNGAPEAYKDGTMTNGDSTESSKKTTMIAAIAGGAALVAIVVAGFIIRHRRDVSRRASAMEAYLSKKVELHMGNDSDDTSTSFSHNNSSNGGNSGQAVYNHRNNSRHERSQQHLAPPSPRHQHVNQHYDNHHCDDNEMILPSMPTLMTTAAGIETSGRYYPQYSPVLVQNRLAPKDQYEKYCHQQGYDHYSHPQEPYDEWYDQNMYPTSMATETTIDSIYRPSPTFVDFPLLPAVASPSAPLAIDTSSKELSSNAAAPAFATVPVSTPFTSPLPRDPHSLTSGSTASSYASVSRNSASAAVAGMKKAKGSSKRSPVVALIASENGEGANGEQSLRRSGSVLFE